MIFLEPYTKETVVKIEDKSNNLKPTLKNLECINIFPQTFITVTQGFKELTVDNVEYFVLNNINKPFLCRKFGNYRLISLTKTLIDPTTIKCCTKPVYSFKYWNPNKTDMITVLNKYGKPILKNLKFEYVSQDTYTFRKKCGELINISYSFINRQKFIHAQ